jgi:hypothetical protein
LLVTFGLRQSEWSLGILAVALMRIKLQDAARARHDSGHGAFEAVRRGGARSCPVG